MAEVPHVLYRLFNAAGALLYVGITSNLDERLKDHRSDKRKTWWPQVAQVTVEHHPTELDARRAESKAIRSEEPAWNKEGRVRLTPGAMREGLRWLRRRLDDEEAAIRAPRRTPRSRRGQEALSAVNQARAVLEEHRAEYPQNRRWRENMWAGGVLPPAALWAWTWRRWGECEACPGQLYPCGVVKGLVAEWRERPLYGRRSSR